MKKSKDVGYNMKPFASCLYEIFDEYNNFIGDFDNNVIDYELDMKVNQFKNNLYTLLSHPQCIYVIDDKKVCELLYKHIHYSFIPKHLNCYLIYKLKYNFYTFDYVLELFCKDFNDRYTENIDLRNHMSEYVDKYSERDYHNYNCELEELQEDIKKKWKIEILPRINHWATEQIQELYDYVMSDDLSIVNSEPL